MATIADLAAAESASRNGDTGAPWYQDSLSFLSNTLGQFANAYIAHEQAEAAGAVNQVPAGTPITQRDGNVIPAYGQTVPTNQIPIPQNPSLLTGVFPVGANYTPLLIAGAAVVLGVVAWKYI